MSKAGSLQLCSRRLFTTSSRSRAAAPLLSLSSIAGPTHPPLSPKTLPTFFKEDILRPYAERPALIVHHERARAHGGPPSRNLGVETHLAWDFGEFDRHIQALARGLLVLGVKKGDRVGVVMGNNRCATMSWICCCIEFMDLGGVSAYATLQWACASVGANLVTLNPAYRLPELVSASQRSVVSVIS